VKLPHPVNTEFAEIGPLFLSNNSSLIFSSDRPGGFGHLDYYYSRELPDGGWSKPENLGNVLNTKMSDAIITISPNLKFLFFTRFRFPEYGHVDITGYKKLVHLLRQPEFGDGTLYWVPADEILREPHANGHSNQ